MIVPSDKLWESMHSRDGDTGGGSGFMGHRGPQVLQNFLESRRSSLSPRASVELTYNVQCKADNTQFIHHTCFPGKSDKPTEIRAFFLLAVKFI